MEIAVTDTFFNRLSSWPDWISNLHVLRNFTQAVCTFGNDLALNCLQWKPKPCRKFPQWGSNGQIFCLSAYSSAIVTPWLLVFPTGDFSDRRHWSPGLLGWHFTRDLFVGDGRKGFSIQQPGRNVHFLLNEDGLAQGGGRCIGGKGLFLGWPCESHGSCGVEASRTGYKPGWSRSPRWKMFKTKRWNWTQVSVVEMACVWMHPRVVGLSRKRKYLILCLKGIGSSERKRQRQTRVQGL